MRVIILFLLFVFTLSASADDQKSLYEVYEEIINFLSRDVPSHRFLKDTNQQCMQEKLNLNEFGSKTVDEDFASSVVTATAIMCTEDQLATYKIIWNNLFANTIVSVNLECDKQLLRDIQPNSKFINENNFDAKANCDISTISKNFEDSKFTVQSYGIFDCINEHKSLEKLFLKLNIAKSKENEVTEDQKKEIIDDIQEGNEKMVQCALQKLEK